MKLKRIFIIVAMSLFMCGCGRADNSDIVSGELHSISAEIFEKITEVRYTGFDESCTTYTDDKTVKAFAEALSSAKEIEYKEQKEGVYLFSFVSDGDIYDLSFEQGGNIILFEGKTYRIDENAGKVLFEISQR